MAALAEQVHVHFADGRQIAVRIVLNGFGNILVGDFHTIVRHGVSAVIVDNGGDNGHENPVEFMPCLVFAGLCHDGDRFRKRAQNADRGVLSLFALGEMCAENGVRIIESGVAYLIKVALIDLDGNDIVIDCRICAHGH